MFYIKLALFLIGGDYPNYVQATWSHKSASPLLLLERLAWHPAPFPSRSLFTELMAAIFLFYCWPLSPFTINQGLRPKINSKEDLGKLLLKIFSSRLKCMSSITYRKMQMCDDSEHSGRNDDRERRSSLSC